MFDLKRFRRDHKLSQIDVAFLFECNQSNIAHFERSGRDLTNEQYHILTEKFGDISPYYTEGSGEVPNNADMPLWRQTSAKWEELVYKQHEVIEKLTNQLEESLNENKRLVDTIETLTTLLAGKKAV